MKQIVKPTSAAMYLCPETSTQIDAFRPSVAPVSNFISSRVAAGQIAVLKAGLPDTATDAEFQKFLGESDGDEALAIESFVASLNKAEEAEETAKAKKGQKAASKDAQ